MILKLKLEKHHSGIIVSVELLTNFILTCFIGSGGDIFIATYARITHTFCVSASMILCSYFNESNSSKFYFNAYYVHQVHILYTQFCFTITLEKFGVDVGRERGFRGYLVLWMWKPRIKFNLPILIAGEYGPVFNSRNHAFPEYKIVYF